MAKKKTKRFGKCGFLAFIVMVVTGTIFGILGVVLTHIAMKYYGDYYLIFVYPIGLAIILGIGLYLGTRIGKCSRLSWLAFLLVFFFSVGCYGSLLFLNHYYDSLAEAERPITIPDEYFLIADDVQNFLAELPWVTDYVQPVENVSRDNIGRQILHFLKTFPERALRQEPIVIGTIFKLAIFAPVEEYLEYPGITRWDDDSKDLVFDEHAVRPWMLWATEWFLLWLITLLITRRGTTRAYDKFQERMKKRGGWQPARDQETSLDMASSRGKTLKEEAPPKAGKKKRSWFGRKKSSVEEGALQETGEPVLNEVEGSEVERKKKKRGWFRRKSEEPEEVQSETSVQAAPGSVTVEAPPDIDLEFPVEEPEQLYALILHQYSSSREDDLIRLIQQVGQVPEERARRLLRVPALIKQGVSTQAARIAIEKFNQVQAQVKLITIEKLEDLQKKQQQAAQPVPKAPPPPQGTSGADSGERYALILRKFDPSQRKPVLELLSSLSNTPVVQLQQTLKTPALVLRDASKDEVTMIAQQFQTIQADVKMLTMTNLQKLMAKK